VDLSLPLPSLVLSLFSSLKLLLAFELESLEGDDTYDLVLLS
jgi:hypothetical protein